MSSTATYRHRSRQAFGGRPGSLLGTCCGRVAASRPWSPPVAGQARALHPHANGSVHAHAGTCSPTHLSADVAAAGDRATPDSSRRAQAATAIIVAAPVPRRQAVGMLAASVAAFGSGISGLLPSAAKAASLVDVPGATDAPAPSSSSSALAPAAVETAGAADAASAETSAASAAPAAEGVAAAVPAAEVVACFVSPGGAADAGVELPPGAERAARFSSVAAAVAACPSGGVVLVAAGRYRERLVLRGQAVTVKAWPQGAEVELLWETAQPYESTVDITGGMAAAAAAAALGGGGGGQVVLEGLTIRHASKSVANNFGVYVHGACSPRLLDCDISSRTGAGVGVEGASPWLLGCRVHDCARQGLAIFGGGADLDLDLSLDPTMDPGLLTGMTGGVVQGCDVYGNALDGVLVRGGAAPDLMDNKVHDNKGSGFNLQDCSGRYSGNVVYDNARGAVSISPLFELDSGDLAGSNSLRGLLRRL